MIDSPTKERSVTMSSQVDTWNVLPKKLKLDELLDE